MCITDKSKCTSISGKRTNDTYTNPVSYDNQEVGGSFTAPDPFVLEFRGCYYCYATDESGVQVSVSDDLAQWHHCGFAYQESGKKNYWAPSVIYLNGLFYMYVSNMPEAEEDTHTEIMFVAVSADPLGPFEKQNELFDTFAIDSQVVRGEDGELYLLYADNQTMGMDAVRPGTSVMVDRMETPLRRAGHPKTLIAPTLDEEIFEKNRFGDGRDWHTVEGATYFSYRDKAFITYSANSYQHENYFVGYSEAFLPVDHDGRKDGAGIETLDWHKHTDNGRFAPLLIRTDNLEGTGHNSIIKAPNNVDDWLVYHGRPVEQELLVNQEQRLMCIDQLYYDSDGLDTAGPTRQPQPKPEVADVTWNFKEGSGERPVIVRGNPAMKSDKLGGRLIVAQEDSILALNNSTQEFDTYIATVWIKARRNAFGMDAGFVARYHDEADKTLIAVRPDGGFAVEDIANKIVTTTNVETDEKADVDWSQWHKLSVERVYSHLIVRIDDLRPVVVLINDKPGRVGLFSNGTDTEFSAFRATDHVNLWGERMQDIASEITAKNTVAVNDALRPAGSQYAGFSLARPLEGYRLVLDFALDREGGKVEINLANNRFIVDGEDTRLEDNGSLVSPDTCRGSIRSYRTRKIRNPAGQALVTVRLEQIDGKLKIHTRGATWSVALLEGSSPCVACSLVRSSLIGYERTSIGNQNGDGEGANGN
ncbi:glycoside hydrolase family 43 protein [Bifidobacterium sp. ESL0764]|uniref:glycoside hydrolase family 43 protein n=1 Tax=Bifidobacterium sp. ESL0764 TaxID=2983228 RepID=UPI0023F6AEDF|nr:glycoside hydrolase family 43 protein [Bifidobacterium sp. ESL0764]WEV65017.1 glycoside hydrolase family 43 protein [Bifidobacterium sp. ESL0764]